MLFFWIFPKMRAGQMKQMRLPMVAPVRPRMVSTEMRAVQEEEDRDQLVVHRRERERGGETRTVAAASLLSPL